MAIRELTKETLGKSKSGWHWDRKRETWVTWQVDTIFFGERHIRRGFRTERDAKEYLAKLDTQERLKEIGVIEAVKYPTVAALFEKRFADIENAAEKTRAKRVFKQFLSVVGSSATIDQIGKKHFKDFANLRVSEGVSKKTVNREINPVAKAFSSVPDYYELPNWTKPPVFRFSVSSEGRKRLIGQDEYRNLLSYFLAERRDAEKFEHYQARRRSGLILQFALMSGLRHGEICGMEKAKLNTARREIDVYRFKTKRWKIYAPLTDTMIYLMNEGAKLYPEGKYFFSEKGKLQAGFYTQIKKACKFYEIPYGKFTEGGFILHDARHNFSTLLMQNLIDNQTSVEFTDNPTAIANYQHSTSESKKRAMTIIEQKFGIFQTQSGNILKTIYEDVKTGKMKFADFKKSIADIMEDSLTVF